VGVCGEGWVEKKGCHRTIIILLVDLEVLLAVARVLCRWHMHRHSAGYSYVRRRWVVDPSLLQHYSPRPPNPSRVFSLVSGPSPPPPKALPSIVIGTRGGTGGGKRRTVGPLPLLWWKLDHRYFVIRKEHLLSFELSRAFAPLRREERSLFLDDP